jgi:7,8-dihydropterin-6-yl-methyl-4-(beta-D-ribofuranosyl)aminobenzene 5'-phosphate synthase
MPTSDRLRSAVGTGILWLAVGLAAPSGPIGTPLASAQEPGLRITYLYDNTEAVPGVRADWGFACIVERPGVRVLFDTGTKPEVLAHNAAVLRVDLGRLDAVVLSHDHGDHTAGFPALGPRPGLPVFYTQGFNPAVVNRLKTSGAKLVAVSKSAEVVPGVRTSEEFGDAIKEEALLLDTADGVVVIVGCSHPGIVPMLQQIKASTGRPIYAVLGGFHLLETPSNEVARMVAAFKEMGVGRVGPTHCTGPDAIRLFKDAYGDRYIAGGVGTVVTVAR